MWNNNDYISLESVSFRKYIGCPEPTKKRMESKLLIFFYFSKMKQERQTTLNKRVVFVSYYVGKPSKYVSPKHYVM